jgi:hypothetical protein
MHSLSDASQVAAAIRRATVAAHRDVEQLDAEALKALEAVYREAAADIAARVDAHAGPDGNLALRELRSALAQVEARLRELGEARDALLHSNLARAADLGVRPYLAAATGHAVVSNGAGMLIANEALQFVRTFVAADGLQLSDRIWRIDRGARDAVVNAIEQAVIQGHGAGQAAREFLARGMPVPDDIAGKLKAGDARQIGQTIESVMTDQPGNPMASAMRLFRTEINRAHGESFMKGGEDNPDRAGWRYLLSPAHPRPDICDLLSTQNLYGLGPGVYPDRATLPWPAHPNTLSFVEMVFKDEVGEADTAGKETAMAALARLTAEQRAGVLGVTKAEYFDEGLLSKGMIRTPLSRINAKFEASRARLRRQGKIAPG